MTKEPLEQSPEELAEILNRITLPDSPVGIDAKLTHAIIIAYLRELTQRTKAIEDRLAALSIDVESRSDSTGT